MTCGLRCAFLPGFEGVFAVIVRRAAGNVWDVEHTADGRIYTKGERVRRIGAMAHNAAGLLDRLPHPGRLGGIDINRPRARAVMQAPPRRALLKPGGVHLLGTRHDGRPAPRRPAVLAEVVPPTTSGSSAARGWPPGSRVHADTSWTPAALRAMAALLLLRDKVLCPLLAAASTSGSASKPRVSTVPEQRHAGAHREMRSLFDTIGIAA